MGDENAGESEEWIKQMQLLDELDYLENTCKEKIISPEFCHKLTTLISQFPGSKRLPLYRIMVELDWNNDAIYKYYVILSKTELSSVHQMLNVMEDFVPQKLLDLFLIGFHSINSDKIVELIYSIKKEDVMYIVQVIRHAAASDIDRVGELINSLSFKEMLEMLQKCNEPMANKCRMCKVKKLKSLETRLLNDQVPQGVMKTAGELVIHLLLMKLISYLR